MKHEWTFYATVEEVVDGDTLKLNIDQGFRDWRIRENFRLGRIDAPETKLETYDLGKASENFVEKILKLHDPVILIKSRKHGKYRWIIEVFLKKNANDLEHTVNLNDMIVEAGHAIYKEF